MISYQASPYKSQSSYSPCVHLSGRLEFDDLAEVHQDFFERLRGLEVQQDPLAQILVVAVDDPDDPTVA